MIECASTIDDSKCGTEKYDIHFRFDDYNEFKRIEKLISAELRKTNDKNMDSTSIGKDKEMRYSDIYEMFDNIFAWIEKFYLGDNCYFVVNKNGASFHRDGGLIILPKVYRERVPLFENGEEIEQKARETFAELKKSLANLNKGETK